MHDGIEHLVLDRLDHAGTGSLGQQAGEFLLRDAGIARAGDAQQAQHGVGRAAQDPDDGRTDPGNQRHRRRRPAGDALRIRQGQPLRHELAHDQRQVGDEDDDAADRQGVGGRRRHAGRGQRFGEMATQCRAAIGAGEDPDQRDAELDGGQEAGRIVQQPQRRPRTAIAVDGQLFEPAPPRRHHRQLGHRQGAVQQHQAEHERHLGDDSHGRSCGGLAGCGRGRAALPAQEGADEQAHQCPGGEHAAPGEVQAGQHQMQHQLGIERQSQDGAHNSQCQLGRGRGSMEVGQGRHAAETGRGQAQVPRPGQHQRQAQHERRCDGIAERLGEGGERREQPRSRLGGSASPDRPLGRGWRARSRSGPIGAGSAGATSSTAPRAPTIRTRRAGRQLRAGGEPGGIGRSAPGHGQGRSAPTSIASVPT